MTGWIALAPSPTPSPPRWGRGGCGYDAKGNLLSTTDPRNDTTTIAYNSLGQVTSVTDPLTHATSITYNANGQPASVTDALGNITTFEYDAQGNLITTTDPLGNRTTRTYDAVSRLATLTDPRDFTTQFAYDALNRVTQITDANGGITGFTYDPNGNLLTVTDPRGKTTTYTYDNMDRLLTRTDALGRIERYEYDKNGNLTKFTDRRGQVSTFTYDALNRRIAANYGDGSSVSFVYDAVGRLISATDSVAGLITFVYDNLNRLAQEITAKGSISYTYDAIGRRTAMTVSGQQPVSYGYDAASRLVQVQQNNQVVGLAYDATGRRTSLTYPNSTGTAYSYDTASRLTNILHQAPSAVIDSLTYTYDAAGNRISVTRANDIPKPLPTAVQAAYDAANEQIQFNSSTPNLSYDANGNLTNDGTNTYTWDARNRLTAINGPGVSASFVYDALGRRTSKTISGVTTQYLYDGNDIVQEIGGGAVGATYLRSLNIEEPFVRQSSNNEFYHTDALGSVLTLTGQTGAIQTSYNYEAFGKTTISGSSSNPFQYTGRENDGTGLYYYRARYYIPLLQRFTAEDPFPAVRVIPQTLNRYPYVLNDPLSYRDPSGRVVPFVLAGIGAAAAVAGALAQGETSLDDLVVSALIGAGGALALAYAIPATVNVAIAGVSHPSFVLCWAPLLQAQLPLPLESQQLLFSEKNWVLQLLLAFKHPQI